MKKDVDKTMSRRFFDLTDGELQILAVCSYEKGYFEILGDIRMEQRIRERRPNRHKPKECN